MLLKRRDMRGRKEMIGILFGVRRSLLISCTRRGCSLIRKSTIFETFMSSAERICSFGILKSIKKIYKSKASNPKPNPITSIPPLSFCPQNMWFSLTSSKNTRRWTRKEMSGSWSLQENPKGKVYSYLINYHRFLSGKIIQ